jgi:hypothetical protein
VLPEGVMLNYLLRRPSPLRILTLMPPEILIFGEDAVLQSLVSAPPDFVAVVSKDTSEYGYPRFGTAAHYGERTLRWIRSHYRSVAVVGQVRDVESGIEILEREARQSQPAP